LTSKTETVAELISRVADLVRTSYVPDSPTHDLSHLARVAALSSKICSTEGGSQLIVLCGAWLHDLHREAQGVNDAFFVSPEEMDDRALRIMDKAGIPPAAHAHVLEAIHYTDTFSFSDRSTYQTAVEAKIVRDADCLDAIGAIGIARAFTFGGSRGIPMWKESAFKPDSTYRQSERPSSTIQHFYDKLLRLGADLETPSARKLGSERSEYLTDFVKHFMHEWSEDLDAVAAGRWLEIGLA
jgi:uncharacterized protein